MSHNICSFPRLTDKHITNKEMYELLLLSDLYCSQGKSLGGVQFRKAEIDDQIHRPEALPCVYIVNIFDFIKLFIH